MKGMQCFFPSWFPLVVLNCLRFAEIQLLSSCFAQKANVLAELMFDRTLMATSHITCLGADVKFRISCSSIALDVVMVSMYWPLVRQYVKHP